MKNDLKNFYVFIGDKRSWEVSVSKNIWGYPNKFEKAWTGINLGDFCAFYVTAPVSKIIGFGKIVERYIDESLIWPDEKLFKRSLWKYKIKFEKIFVIDEWDNGIKVSAKVMLNGGVKHIKKELFEEWTEEAKKKWNVKIIPEITK